MKVSVITICFNSADTLEDTIKSVLGQTYADVEYIVVDGGSTDETPEIIDLYRSTIDHYVSEPDNGIYDAMNKGVLAATGDIVCILNSDDVYSNQYVLEEVVNDFTRNPEVKILFGNLVFKDSALTVLKRVCRFTYYKPSLLRFGWMPPHPASFVKREIYSNFGLYSMDYKISADYEIFVRWLLVNKLKWHHKQAILVDMRVGGVSTSGLKNSILLNKEIVKACRSNGVYTNSLLLLLKIPFKLLELRL